MKSVIDCSKCIHCEVCGNRYANDGCAGECSYFSEHNPSGGLTEAEKIICRIYLEDLDKRHACGEYKLLMSLIDNAQEIKYSLLPLSGEADNAYMRGYEVGKAEGILKASTRQKGEWEIITFPHSLNKYKCNQCHHYIYAGMDRNFCPNCGADMRKGGAE